LTDKRILMEKYWKKTINKQIKLASLVKEAKVLRGLHTHEYVHFVGLVSSDRQVSRAALLVLSRFMCEYIRPLD
jgi:RNA polymerase-interacting CarD/CdnL/TRCF family regulator